MSVMHQIKTPIPGIFYRRPSPAEPPFVEVGSTVQVGETLGMIEIMKSFHPVVSDVAGEVVAILDDTAEVVPGMDVAEIRQDAGA